MIFIKNKYSTWYFQIIENAKSRQIQPTKFEKHHITPRSLGGANNKDNLVNLSLREHYVCHLLLTKMCVYKSPEWCKMVLGLKLMSQTREGLKVNSRIFAHIRKLTSIVSSTMVRTPESNKKRSIALVGRESPTKGLVWSNASRRKLSKSKTGKKLSDETKEKLRQQNLGKSHSNETKEKLRQRSKELWARRRETGWVSPAKHRPRTEKEKARLREVNLGKKLSDETKEKISKSVRETLQRKQTGYS